MKQKSWHRINWELSATRKEGTKRQASYKLYTRTIFLTKTRVKKASTIRLALTTWVSNSAISSWRNPRWSTTSRALSRTRQGRARKTSKCRKSYLMALKRTIASIRAAPFSNPFPVKTSSKTVSAQIRISLTRPRTSTLTFPSLSLKGQNEGKI